MPIESHKNALSERMLSVKKVASTVSVHPSMVRRREKEGVLKAYRVGPRGSLRFDEDVIIERRQASPLRK